jgi:hypothetical protein
MDSEMTDVNVKNEPEPIEELVEDDNDDDPVVKELDVYLSRSLAENIYVLQVRNKTLIQ